jgi:hypothetical protein
MRTISSLNWTRALDRAEKAMRHGKPGEAKIWMDLVERFMKLEETIGRDERAEQRHDAFRAEHPHRLKWLENRSRFPR